jgi:outer membrane protein assembly factor BamA
LLSGCASRKYVPEGQYLVNKYNVNAVNKPPEVNTADLKSFLKPRPNKKTLGIRFKLHHYFREQVKPTKFNKWKNKNFGEEPVYFDDEHVERLGIKMERFLDNSGFFNSKVTFDVEFGKKVADVTFTVETVEPYRIKKISYDISDTVVAGFFWENIKKTLLREGDIYNAFTMDDERDRITDDLRNTGYYYFNRNYIQFIVDSSFNNRTMEVVLKINNVKKKISGTADEFVEVPHKRYFIKNVEVIPDWKPIDTLILDTVPHQIKFWNDTNTYIYDFLLDEKKRIKPSAFNSTILIKPNQPYSAQELEQTYRRIFNFRIIRSANISYDTVGAGGAVDGSFHYMNSRIQMRTAKLNTFQAELEGTNSSGDLGMRGSVGVSNRNIFKRADVLTIRLNAGAEAQSWDTTTRTFFNTVEVGIRGTLFFPRFLFPIRLTKFHQRYNPVTNINFGFSYQIRPQYDRNLTNLELQYNWDQSKKINHILTLINLNYVNIYNIRKDFQDAIDSTQNQRLREQYSDHFIAGIKYSFIYSSQNLSNKRHFNYFRTNLETAGNLLNAISQLSGQTKAIDEDSGLEFYKIGDVRYAQYVRGSFDYRYYYFFGEKKSSLAIRLLTGIAIPYGNSNQVPYEKGFFGGGANDMRGWQFRQLGPGGVANEQLISNLERVGDIQIETNIEYRFPIYKAFKGALFLDVGNIWLLDTNNTFPNGEFDWNTWYQQLAVNTGLGARLDFDFFIFRVDFAIPLVDPAYWSENEQVRINKLQWRQFVVNFGIGYPF